MKVTLSDNAVKKIHHLIQEENSSQLLRFRVMISGGGCAGFQYQFSLDQELNDDDYVFDENGISIVIDEASLPFVQGAEIDYIEELIGASFQIKNPNASSSCGCGSSFSV